MIINGKAKVHIFLIIYTVIVIAYYKSDYFKINFLPVSSYIFYSEKDDRLLLKAIVNNDIDSISRIIDNLNIDINKLDRTGEFTFLQFAFISSNKKTFSKLLEYGAIPDRIRISRNVFTLSTLDKDSFYIKKLFDYPDNFINYNEAISGHHIFFGTLKRSEALSRFSLLLDSGADPNRARPNWPVSPIKSALSDCDYDRVLILLNHGAIFDTDAIRWLIEPPSPRSYKKRESSASREDIVVFLKKHYDLELILKHVIDVNTGEVIK